MKTELSYKEIEKLIHDKVGKDLRVYYEDSRTVKVSYDIDLLFTTKTVDVFLEISKVNLSSLKLRYYSNGFAVEKIISVILSWMDSRIYFKGEDNTIMVYLDNIKCMESVFNNIYLNDVRFSSSGANVLLQLK